MGSPLPLGPPCCSRAPKVAASTSQVASPPNVFLAQGRVCTMTQRSRRVAVSSFMFNPSANGSSNGRSNNSITNRLSELRSRSEEEDRAFMNERSDRGAEEVDGDLSTENAFGRRDDEAGPRIRRQLGPWPAESGSPDEDGDDANGFGQGISLAGAAPGATMTPRSLRFLTSDPKPEIKLLHRFKPGHGPGDDFWRSFVDKCRLAWGVFFPPAAHHIRRPAGIAKWAGGISRFLQSGSTTSLSGPDSAAVNGLSAKQVVLSRLQMVLIADRCGVSPEQLLEMKAQTLTALAEYMGKDLEDNVAQLEVQVSALKPNGERVTMTIGFADMLADEQLRDPLQYHYEFEDDDDYFLPEDDDGRVAEIAEAPVAGLKAARVAAQPVGGAGPVGKSRSEEQ